MVWVYYVDNYCGIKCEEVNKEDVGVGGSFRTLTEAKKFARELAKSQIKDIKETLDQNRRLSPKWLKFEAKLGYGQGSVWDVQKLIDDLLQGTAPTDEFKGKCLSFLRQYSNYLKYLDSVYYPDDLHGYTSYVDNDPTYLSYISDRWRSIDRIGYLIKGLEDDMLVKHYYSEESNL